MNQIVNVNPNMGAVSSVFGNAPKTDNELSGGITGGYAIMSIRGKVWSIRHHGQDHKLMRDDGDGPRGSIDVIILKASPTLSKIWYEGGWVDGSNAAPDCSSANGLVPDPSSPKKQSTTCATCPRNAWGSDRNGGKGKDCGDSRRMAIVPLTDIDNESFGGPILLRCPAASLQDLASFGSKLQGLGYPYYAIGVKIAFDPQESYPKLVFSAIRPLNDAEAMKVVALQKGDAVARVIAEDIAQPQAQIAAPTSASVFEQPGQQAAPSQVFAAQPSPQQVAPAPQPAPQPAPAPAPVSTGGFGPITTAAPPPQAAPAPAPQPAPQPVTQQVAAPPPVQPIPQGMTGFGPAATAAPAPAPQAAPQPAPQPVQQSFPDAANGAAPLTPVQAGPAPETTSADFTASLDERLAGLLGTN